MDYQYQDPKVDESIFHSINSVLVYLGSKMKRQLCSIATLFISDVPPRRTFVSHSRHLKASAELISDLWFIGIKKAKATLEATTQQCIRSAILSLSRRYQANRVYSLKRINKRFSTDNLFSDIKSLNQNVCAQLFIHRVGLSAVYPLREGSVDTIGQSCKYFCHDYGVPDHLNFDGAIAQVGKNTLFMKTIKWYSTRYHVSSPRRPDKNPTEGTICEIKKRWYRIMLKNKVPIMLWDHGLI